MTLEEAEFILPTEDFEDVYDEKLFELKQFFVSKLIHPKLFNSRLDKLKKLNEAMTVKGGIFNSINTKTISLSGESIVEVFNSYADGLSQLKALLLQSNNGKEVEHLVAQMIFLTNEYASEWEKPQIAISAETKVSEQFDPMEIFNEVKSQSASGINSFDQIAELSDDNILVKEAKRLTLWRKLYADG